MQLIIINGPSGSGKTTFSKKLSKELKYGIILNTDNYYKTGIISRILSKIVPYYFDRKISFNIKIFKRDLDFILKNGYSNYSYNYDFKKKTNKKVYKKTTPIKYVIIEGIFGKEIIEFSSYSNSILIQLKTNKQTCMERVIKRDFKNRGKTKNNAQRDFLNAWKLFHRKQKKINSKNFKKEFLVKNKDNRRIAIKQIINIVNKSY